MLKINNQELTKDSSIVINNQPISKIYNGSKLIHTSVMGSAKEWRDAGFTQDGIYRISPDGINEYNAYCDMTTDGGGWTLFSSNSMRLVGAAASAGAINAGVVGFNIIDAGTRDITDINWSNLMAVQLDENSNPLRWVSYNNITNTNTIKTEWKDFNGETSSNTNAQSTFGHAEIRAFDGTNYKSFVTNTAVVEIHHSHWNPALNTNWILSEKERKYGNGLLNNWAITSHGNYISIDSNRYTDCSGTALFYK